MAGEKDAAFDPYHKWLGIPKIQRPPTHYQLLGLTAGESDTEVIEEAAIRQTTHVRAYQVGPHATVCTRVLNEISQARQVLLNPAKRKEYDKKLAQQAAAAGPPPGQQITAQPPPPLPTGPDPFGALDSDQEIARPRAVPGKSGVLARGGRPAGRPEPGRSSRGLVIGLAVAGAVFVIGIAVALGVYFAHEGEDRKPIPIVKKEEPVKPLAVDPVKPEPPIKVEPVKPEPVKPEPVKPMPPIVVIEPEPVPVGDPYVGRWQYRAPSGARNIDLVIRKTDAYAADLVLKTGKDYVFRSEPGRFVKGQLKFALSSDDPPPFGSNYDELTVYPEPDGSLRGFLRTRVKKGIAPVHFLREGAPAIAKVNPPPPPNLAEELAGTWLYASGPSGFGPVTFPFRAEMTLRPGEDAYDVRLSLHVRDVLSGQASNDRVRVDPGLVLKFTPNWERVPETPLDVQEVTVRYIRGPNSLSVLFRTRTRGIFSVLFKRGEPAPVVKAEPAPKVDKKEPAAARAEPPAEDKIRDIQKTLLENYGKKYAAAKLKASDRVALAEEFFQLGQDTKDDLASRYVLLSEARDLASQAGKWTLAADVLELLNRDFKIDVLAQREATLQGFVKTAGGLTKEEAVLAAEAALQAVGDAITADQHERAQSFVSLAGTAASRASSSPLVNQVKKYETELKTLAQEFEEFQAAREKAKAGDPAANRAVGRYLALRKNDWDQGLAHLSKAAPDDELAALARRELEKPAAFKSQQDLGDAWWGLAEKEKDSSWLKAAYLHRAGHWYRLALPQASGLPEKLIGERLKVVEDAPTPFAGNNESLGELRRYLHGGGVTSLVLAADGKLFYSGGLDAYIRTWDLSNTKEFRKHKALGAVQSFAVSPDKRWLAINGKDTVQVVDASTGKPNTGLASEPSVPGSFWGDGDRLRIVGSTGRYRLFEASARNLASSDPFPVTPTAIRGSFDGQFLVTLGKDVRLFRMFVGTNPNVMQTFTVPDATAAAFSQDNRLLALGSSDGKIRLFDVNSGSAGATFDGSTGTPRALAFSAAGNRLLSGGDDKAVRLWDIPTGKELTRFALHTAAVQAVLFTPDNRHALSAGSDGTIRMWILPRDKK